MNDEHKIFRKNKAYSLNRASFIDLRSKIEDKNQCSGQKARSDHQ